MLELLLVTTVVLAVLTLAAALIVTWAYDRWFRDNDEDGEE